MHTTLEVKLHADHHGSERSDNLGPVEPKASFHFIIKREDVVVSTTTNRGGSNETVIIGTRCLGCPEKVFNVEFFHLLLPIINEICIKDMLIQFPILSPATIEGGLKQQISRYALGKALLCQERRARFLDIFVCFTFHCVIQDIDLARLIMVGTVDDGDNGGFSRVPASQFSIQALEINKFDDLTTEDQEQSSTCMICVDKFVKGVEIVRLPCTHFFHGECIFKWLENKNSCPLCRFALPAEESD
ncbi:hypothetical protein NE237_032619 [Protea cynaroides]|uniref:RING-type domain-containing protein n=1 Tax=Protea cynaroides TaxID=273540 RepID=A0A9Q0L3N3_9MAGN|nr:hypothetical protein NE237_032619 [Protea cynaroides]